MKRTSFTLAVALFAIVGLLSASHLTRSARAQSDNAKSEGAGGPEIIKHRTNPRGVDSYSLTTGSTSPTSPISYHGGPLIQTPTVYMIWYGNWNQSNGSDTPAGQQIVRDFASNIGGSPYFLINTSYSTGPYTITGSVLFRAGDFQTTGGNEATDSYSQGTRLRDASILTIVNNAINSGHLPYDANGVYFVLTSSDVNESSGFCSKYCGWHTAGTATTGHVRYAFVGNANRCLNACAAQTISPNSNAGVDGMISVIAHELEEATTDPDPRSGWADSVGNENADKCAWTFGHFQQQLPSGAWYNITLGSRNFLIQRNLYHNLVGPNGLGDYCMMDAAHN
ncbi:MAG TPA: hypothetical protein VKB86_11710 [Pyrinomonadaceae bacterium]|nr:hypothetical protein [Pyrinomonadaceae bacterium]